MSSVQIVVTDEQLCERIRTQELLTLKKSEFYVMWILSQKKATPRPNRVPWAHPVQSQPHKRWSTGTISERTLTGQVSRNIPKSSHPAERLTNLLDPVCSNSPEDPVLWCSIRSTSTCRGLPHNVWRHCVATTLGAWGAAGVYWGHRCC